MEITLAVCAILLGVLGIIGSIVPALPGPPLSWLGLLVLYIWGSGTCDGMPLSSTRLFVWLGIVTVVTILDYVVPAYFTKLTGGSKYGSWGAIVGLLIGLFLTPIGILLGTFLGAFLGELLFANKDTADSLKSALGAFIGFIFGTGMKLVCCGFLMYDIVLYAF